jgi:transposase
MRKIREVLRLHAQGWARRQIARSVGVAHSTIREYLRRAEAAGLSWPLPPDLTDSELEARLFPPPKPSTVLRPLPVWSEVNQELRKKGVTLQLVWLEYKELELSGFSGRFFACGLRRHCRGKSPFVADR